MTRPHLAPRTSGDAAAFFSEDEAQCFRRFIGTCASMNEARRRLGLSASIFVAAYDRGRVRRETKESALAALEREEARA